MKRKSLFWLLAVLSFLNISCDKNSPAGNDSENNGDKPDEPLVELPELEETDDVCTKMDDMNFMAYCYDNFDVNGDSKVSMSEANAVDAIKCNDATSFVGLEYFTNIKSFTSSSVEKVDFRYNKNLETIDCSRSNIESIDLRYNDKLASFKFSYCTRLTTVILPNNLTSIGAEAFYGCSSITSIDIPESVTSIEEKAFYGCSSITSIDIPDSVTIIGLDAFDYCNSLTSIILPESITSITYSAFTDCSSLISIVIPEGVTSITGWAFEGCSSLKTVNASQCKNMERIDSYTFSSCPIQEFLLGTPNPPVLEFNIVSGHGPFDDLLNAILKVPAESVEAYKNSDWADYFGTIEAL